MHDQSVWFFCKFADQGLRRIPNMRTLAVLTPVAICLIRNRFKQLCNNSLGDALIMVVSSAVAYVVGTIGSANVCETVFFD